MVAYYYLIYIFNSSIPIRSQSKKKNGDQEKTGNYLS